MSKLAFLTVLTIGCLSVGFCYDECPNPPYNNAISKQIYDGIEALRPLMTTGVPEKGIPPVDPLGPLPKISFNVNNKYISLYGHIDYTTIYNLAEFVTCELRVEIGLRPEFYLEFRLDDFKIDGEYDIRGMILRLFPVFGHGNYRLEAFDVKSSVGAKVSYNIITRHAQIKNLEIDVELQKLELYLECILGCGEMSDFVNDFLDEIATAIFQAVWNFIDDPMTQFLEDKINEILKDVKIPPTKMGLEEGKDLPTDKQKIHLKFPLNQALRRNHA